MGKTPRASSDEGNPQPAKRARVDKPIVNAGQRDHATWNAEAPGKLLRILGSSSDLNPEELKQIMVPMTKKVEGRPVVTPNAENFELLARCLERLHRQRVRDGAGPDDKGSQMVSRRAAAFRLAARKAREVEEKAKAARVAQQAKDKEVEREAGKKGSKERREQQNTEEKAESADGVNGATGALDIVTASGVATLAAPAVPKAVKEHSFVKELEDLITNADGTAFELIFFPGEPEPPQYEGMPSLQKDTVCVQLTVSLDPSFSARGLLAEQLNGRLVVRCENKIDPGGTQAEKLMAHKRASNKAAKMALIELKKMASEVEAAARAKLAEGLKQRFEYWRLAKHEERRTKAFLQAKALVCNDQFGGLYGAKIHLYGSAAAGLALPDSDIDVAVLLPVVPRRDSQPSRSKDSQCTDKKHTEVLRYMNKFVLRAGMERVMVVDSARVPLLCYFDPQNNVDVDMTVASSDGMLVTRLFRKHMHHDRRIWELAMAVRYWAKQRGISGAAEKFINPMGWTIMAIYFLQHWTKPAVASLFAVSKRVPQDMSNIFRVPWRSSLKAGHSGASIAELMAQFFRFYGFEFSFDKQAISINLQQPQEQLAVSKLGRKAVVFIEQPLVPGENVVGYLSSQALSLTRVEIRRAHFQCAFKGSADRLFEERRTQMCL